MRRNAPRSRRRTRAVRALMALVCALTLTAGELTPALAVTQADINALQENSAQLAERKKQLKSQLSELADDKKNILKRKSLLDEQIGTISSEIANTETQIAQYAALIVQTETELADAQAREEAQYDLFCRRVRAMEERGEISYWSVLFKANSFTDLLGRLDAVNEVMDADQAVIDQLQTLQAEIQGKQEELESSKAASEAAKAALVENKSELNTQRAAADKLVKEIEANESAYEDTLDKIDAEEESIQKKIMELSRQLAAQNGSSNVALGGYIWPVPSRRITSPMGSRYTGIPGASTNHKGVDIGGVGYTTEVHAAKAGTVIVSQKSSSYGNYVVVSHGSGNTTLYGHMSSRSVSVNQYVNQGDVLGITGSTGISSGPHLHFEITENGDRVNPLSYLTGYTQAW